MATPLSSPANTRPLLMAGTQLSKLPPQPPLKLCCQASVPSEAWSADTYSPPPPTTTKPPATDGADGLQPGRTGDVQIRAPWAMPRART